MTMLNKLIERACTEVPEKEEYLRGLLDSRSNPWRVWGRYCVAVLGEGRAKRLYKRVEAGEEVSLAEWRRAAKVECAAVAAKKYLSMGGDYAAATWAVRVAENLVEEGSTWEEQAGHLIQAFEGGEEGVPECFEPITYGQFYDMTN